VAKNRFHQVFARPRVVLPVIHVESRAQALTNARIAWEAGADGVFLINHGLEYERLLEIHQQVAAAQSGWWIGVNCLDLAPEDVFAVVPDSVHGVWTDNAQVEEGEEAQPAAGRVLAVQQRHGWRGLYFGGVAFKYQREVHNLAAACQIASRYMDVVTTSGAGTGQAATVEKIRIMKQALGDHPLAIASGITPENVREYLPYADCFLVATGISRTFSDFEPAKVSALVQRVRSYSD